MKTRIKITSFIILLIVISSNALARDDVRLYREAMSFIDKGSYEFALLKLQHIMDIFPDSKYADEAQFLIGEIYYKQGVSWNAEKELNKHLKLFPRSKFSAKRNAYLDELRGKTMITEADLLCKDEKWNEALDLYLKALKLNPELKSLEDKINKCNEVIKFEKSQIEKGLVKYEGQWMTVEEKNKLDFAKRGIIPKKEKKPVFGEIKDAKDKNAENKKVIYCLFAEGTDKKDLNDVDKALIAIESESNHGSGFLINSEGYAITNYHVVKDKKSVTSYLTGEKPINAEVMLTVPDKDLAVIKLAGKKYDFLKLANAKNIKVGDEVYVAGAPLSIGLMNSLSKGIVSGLREVEDKDRKITLIQTDASVNPGSSGGPLIDKNGNVIGIVALKSSVYNTEGLGFAISIEDAKKFLNLKEEAPE